MAALTFFAVMVAQSLMGGLPVDGISCDRMEGAVEHIHSRLELYDRGKAIAIPEGVGIPPSSACLYWLHTHSDTGYIHIESPVKKPFTLGQFFDIWGEDLSWTKAGAMSAPHGGRLTIWINGTKWHGNDPRAIVLKDRELIVIQNGPPFAKPAAPDWDKL